MSLQVFLDSLYYLELFFELLPRTQTNGALVPTETLGRKDVLTTANFVLDSFIKGAQSHLLESGGKVRERDIDGWYAGRSYLTNFISKKEIWKIQVEQQLGCRTKVLR